jgi:type IV pilus assembly protein PilO
VTVTRKIALGALAAAVVVTALWFLLLWRPQSGDLAAARDREQAASAANVELTLRRDRLAATAAEAPSMEADLAALEVAVPDDPRLAELLLAANDAATAAGVDFLSISPTPPVAAVDPAHPASVHLAVTVDGGYFQVLDYLDRLAALERIVVVDTLDLAPSGGEGGGLPTRLSASLGARMFTTLAGDDGGDGSAGTPPATASPASATATTPTTASEATS